MYKETEIRICDLANKIKSMSPITILINGKKVWSDDIDLTNLTPEEAQLVLCTNLKQLDEILHREDLVWEITYHIVQHHHSAVYIKTL